MKTRTQKQDSVKVLKKELPAANVTIFTAYARPGEKGLSVAQMRELRVALRALGAKYLAVKKTLLGIALNDSNYDGLDVNALDGSLGVVVGGQDPYIVSKEIYKFAKKNQALKFFGAVLDGKFMGKDEFVVMAQLPSRDELIARLLGMMKYPLSSLAIVLDQISKQKDGTAVAK